MPAHDVKYNLIFPNSPELKELDHILKTNVGYSDWNSVPSERNIGELQINKTAVSEYLIRETKGAILYNFEEDSNEIAEVQEVV